MEVLGDLLNSILANDDYITFDEKECFHFNKSMSILQKMVDLLDDDNICEFLENESRKGNENIPY